MTTARTAVRAAALCAVGGVLAGLAACGAGSDLSLSCTEYLKKGQADQTHIASEWANPQRNGKTTTLSDAVASHDRALLVQYCQQSGHGKDTIGSLEQGLGFGNG